MHFKCTPRKHVAQQCGPPPPESSEQRTNIRKLSITYFISGCKKTKGWVRGGEGRGGEGRRRGLILAGLISNQKLPRKHKLFSETEEGISCV